MKHATRRLVPCCLAIACLAACSGDDDALPTEPPVEPRETTTSVGTVTPTTEFVPPTTDVPLTSVPSTSSPLSVAISTTSPPTTATTDADVQAALAAVDGFYVRWRECLRDIPSCDPLVFAEVADPAAAADFAAQIADRQAEHQRAENVDSYTYSPTGTRRVEGRIVVTVCQRDAMTLYRQPPGEPELLMSEGFVSKLREWHVDPTGAGWRIVGAATIEEAIGVENDLCS